MAYTRLPVRHVTAILQSGLPSRDATLAVFAYVAHKTLGHGKAADQIAYRQFATDLGIADKTTRLHLGRLVDLDLLIVDPSVAGRTGQLVQVKLTPEEREEARLRGETTPYHHALPLRPITTKDTVGLSILIDEPLDTNPQSPLSGIVPQDVTGYSSEKPEEVEARPTTFRDFWRAFWEPYPGLSRKDAKGKSLWGWLQKVWGDAERANVDLLALARQAEEKQGPAESGAATVARLSGWLRVELGRPKRAKQPGQYDWNDQHDRNELIANAKANGMDWLLDKIAAEEAA